MARIKVVTRLSNDEGGNGGSPVADLVKMGVNAMAGGGGRGGSSGGGGSQVMDLVNMGANLMGAVGGGNGGGGRYS